MEPSPEVTNSSRRSWSPIPVSSATLRATPLRPIFLTMSASTHGSCSSTFSSPPCISQDCAERLANSQHCQYERPLPAEDLDPARTSGNSCAQSLDNSSCVALNLNQSYVANFPDHVCIEPRQLQQQSQHPFLHHTNICERTQILKPFQAPLQPRNISLMPCRPQRIELIAFGPRMLQCAWQAFLRQGLASDLFDHVVKP